MNDSFQPGDSIVVFMVDPSDVRRQIELHGWYCGMNHDLHVYLLKTVDGEIIRRRTPMVDMCHLADVQRRRDEWTKLFGEPETVKSQVG